MVDLDYSEIFARLDVITGLPLVLRGNKWYGAVKMDGEPSHRRDKLVCRLIPGNVQLLEQGGDVKTIFSYLVDYRGMTKREAFKCLKDCTAYDAPRIEIPPEPPIRHIKYRYGANGGDMLWRFLCTRYSKEAVREAYRRYGVTSDGRYTVFWYQNFRGQICHDKKMLYKSDGHRDKEYGGGRYYRVAAGYRDRCFFGEHAFSEDEKLYVVESEKTALLFWLRYHRPCIATGGKQGLFKAKKNWILLPDRDAYEDWEKVCPGQCVRWWDELHWECPEKADIGDYILFFR